MTEHTTSTGAPQPTVIESQLDWLTCGWDEGQAADRAEAWAFSKAQAEARLGAREAPFRLMGFSGWAVGRVRFGRRDASALLQLSGQLADAYADTLVPMADRVSRVDLAVTVRLPTPDPFLGETTYAQASNYRADHPKAALPWLVQDDDGGCTAYVGKRTSDTFLRVYNKQAESTQAHDAVAEARYQSCWRYELECKGDTAKAMATAATSGSSRAAFVQGQLHEYCRKHGIEPVFPNDGDRMLIPGFRRRSDYQSRLAWLRSSVRPAIAAMLPEGDMRDIIEALGVGEADNA